MELHHSRPGIYKALPPKTSEGPGGLVFVVRSSESSHQFCGMMTDSNKIQYHTGPLSNPKAYPKNPLTFHCLLKLYSHFSHHMTYSSIIDEYWGDGNLLLSPWPPLLLPSMSSHFLELHSAHIPGLGRIANL